MAAQVPTTSWAGWLATRCWEWRLSSQL